MTQHQPAKAPILLPLVLIALGAALIAVAILVPLYSRDELVKASLSDRIELVSVAQGSGQDAPGPSQEYPAQVFDRCTLKDGAARAGVLDAKVSTRTYITVEEPSGPDTVTYQAGTSVLVSETKAGSDGPVKTLTAQPIPFPQPGAPPPPDQCDNGLLFATIDRVTVDRRNGFPVANGASEVQVEPGPLRTLQLLGRTGQQYRFPFGTTSDGKYTFFDLSARAAFPVTYVDSSEIRGLKTLHFHVDVPETDLAYADKPAGVSPDKWTPPPGTTLEKPASWWGLDGQAPVALHRFYKNAIELYVEPDSGVIVRERQDLNEYFADPVEDRGGAPDKLKTFTLTVFKALLDYDQPTLEATEDEAKSYRDQIALYGQTIPIAAAVLGLVLLVGGGVIYYRLTFRHND